MGHYDDGHPPHSHRTPAEIADDEILEALRGNVCAPVRTLRPEFKEPPTRDFDLTKTRKEHSDDKRNGSNDNH